jgi:hypothetical protein
MTTNQHIVQPNGQGNWEVLRTGNLRASGTYETKVEAVAADRQLPQNTGTELVIKKLDGTIERRDSHGNDPSHPKDKEKYTMTWNPAIASTTVQSVLLSGGTVQLTGTQLDLEQVIYRSLNSLSPLYGYLLRNGCYQCPPCGDLTELKAAMATYGSTPWDQLLVDVYEKGGKILYGFNGSIATATITI